MLWQVESTALSYPFGYGVPNRITHTHADIHLFCLLFPRLAPLWRAPLGFYLQLQAGSFCLPGFISMWDMPGGLQPGTACVSLPRKMAAGKHNSSCNSSLTRHRHTRCLAGDYLQPNCCHLISKNYCRLTLTTSRLEFNLCNTSLKIVLPFLHRCAAPHGVEVFWFVKASLYLIFCWKGLMGGCFSACQHFIALFPLSQRSHKFYGH